MKQQHPERERDPSARRRQAESVFFAALEQAGDERIDFVKRRCAGDSGLERTVLSLLEAHERRGPFDRLEGERSRWRDELLGRHAPTRWGARAGNPDADEEERTLTADLLRSERYRIHRLLGRGGMGEVWHAYDLKLRLDVALKSVRPDLVADERTLELLRREVRAAREVISPNVCRVFDLQELGGREYIAMEYVDGTTLREVLSERGPLELEEAREIASQLLAGLGAIHDAGFVHRDIKPENIMVTYAGRVVVMDFGIMRGLQEGRGARIAGTPAYMSPEQRSGAELDARSDVFSVGVVLAEMVEPGGVRSSDDRERLLGTLHRSVPTVSPTPWARVIEKAVDPDREARFASAASLARALDEVTLRAAGDEDARPYPGLASFGLDDARFFFGRELDVESLMRKLRPPRLLGVIGPSGAGKSSFLRAGLLANLPAGWSAVLATPGNRPFVALARALAEVLPKEAEVVDSLLRFEEPAAAMALISAWRARHEQCLIVLDQFEELFTQSPRDVQTSFAELLGRIPVEADVHVLLSMRDDFLSHCQSQEPLAPLFSELTPIGPPTGAALRKAIVEPARKCGYRFEDEGLVEEMLAEVEGERGSLPMVAFASAQLWELRDTQEGTLTREAYERIGGVAGALAQHAERTLAEIGHDRAPIVHELFRNLVTAQGTRAARTRHELLSVFESGGAGSEPEEEERPSREDAARVLDALVDARLLTSFEVAGAETDEEHRTQIEIIHESLLTSWPRLQRWQAQEAENAEMRDQLRQAAQSWTSRGRPDDLLWSGTLLQEFELWRERYPGGLTSEEQEYARAMASHADRVRRRRRALVAAAVSFLVVSLLVVFGLWRQAASARDESTREALRAESKQLLALGRLALEDDPTAALSFATASLERRDDEESRRLALEALSQGPVAQVVDDGRRAVSVDFSPDGRWLAVGFGNGELELWSSRGERTSLATALEGRVFYVEFGPDSQRLLSVNGSPRARHDVRLWSIPDGEVVWEIESSAPLDARISQASRRVLVLFKQRDGVEVQSWPFDEGTGERVATLDPALGTWATWGYRWNFVVDPGGERFAFTEIGDDGSLGGVEWFGIPGAKTGEQRRFGEEGATALAFDFEGARLASVGPGEVRVWSLDEPGGSSLRLPRRSLGLVRSLTFDRSGELLAAANETGGFVSLWRLADPPDAHPIALRRMTRHLVHDAAFDPGGRWLASAGAAGVAVYPVERRYPFSLKSPEEGVVTGAEFLPDGTAVLVTSNSGTLRRWSLAGDGSVETLLEGQGLNSVAVGPEGRRALAGSAGGRIWLVELDGSEVRPLGEIPEEAVDTLALGSRYAAVSWWRGPSGPSILMWDLATGRSRTLPLGEGANAFDLEFRADDTLLVADENGIHLWHLEDETVRTLSNRPGRFDLSADGRWLLAAQQGENGEAVLYDLETGTNRQLDRHGPSVDVALGADGRVAATLGEEEIRVGPATGEEPHLLVVSPTSLGPTSSNRSLRLRASSDGRWISTSAGNLVLWPVPDLSQPPLHSLPHPELLDKLRSLTNLRVVEDPEAPSGWGLAVEPFEGWERVPVW